MAEGDQGGERDDAKEIQFLLAEYAYEQKRLESALSSINQTVTRFGTLLGLLSAATASAVNLLNRLRKNPRTIAIC